MQAACRVLQVVGGLARLHEQFPDPKAHDDYQFHASAIQQAGVHKLFAKQRLATFNALRVLGGEASQADPVMVELQATASEATDSAVDAAHATEAAPAAASAIARSATAPAAAAEAAPDAACAAASEQVPVASAIAAAEDLIRSAEQLAEQSTAITSSSSDSSDGWHESGSGSDAAGEAESSGDDDEGQVAMERSPMMLHWAEQVQAVLSQLVDVAEAEVVEVRLGQLCCKLSYMSLRYGTQNVTTVRCIVSTGAARGFAGHH